MTSCENTRSSRYLRRQSAVLGFIRAHASMAPQRINVSDCPRSAASGRQTKKYPSWPTVLVCERTSMLWEQVRKRRPDHSGPKERLYVALSGNGGLLRALMRICLLTIESFTQEVRYAKCDSVHMQARTLASA